MNDVDAVPIASVDGKENRAVFGFSSLPRFMALGPKRFANLLKEPCERSSDELASFGVDEDLESVLDTFASRRLGFALVHGVGAAENRRSLVTLGDVLELYRKNRVRTDLLVKEVATPMVSMPGS